MSSTNKLTRVSGVASAALLAALAAGCSNPNPTVQNSAPPAQVASAPPPTITPPPAASGNQLASANTTAPVLDAPAAPNSVAADGAAAPGQTGSGQAGPRQLARSEAAQTGGVQTASVDTADLPPAAQAINQAGPSGARPSPSSRRGRHGGLYDPSLLRLEVLLDRAGFSPGAIDGRDGTNLKRAISAYAGPHGLASNGAPTPQLWGQLTSADSAPVVQAYRITASDAAGPFIGTPPKNYEALSKLPALSYSTPEQELAERFHMSQKLLEALNPRANFGQAGTLITVAAPGAPHDYNATKIVVDKSNDEVRVFGADGKLAAVYPATVGSTERPAPSGQFAVVAVAKHPAYFYDPARLTFTPNGAKGKLRIAPGPNNPVGSTWIALNIPTYGIHGAPDPTMIGKQQSHGCIRLTNWDAAELAGAVKKGVPVDFVGVEKTPLKSARDAKRSRVG